MVSFFQVLIAGLETGSLYALSAFGLILIFRTSHLINFAHSEAAMISTFVALWIYWLTNSYLLAFIGAVAFGMLLGFVMERGPIRIAGKLNPNSKMIVTLGLVMIIDGIACAVFGLYAWPLRKAIMVENLNFGGVIIQPNSLFIMVITIIIMAILFYVIGFTKAGIAIRATAQSEQTAKLMGIPVNRIYSLAWITATGLTAITGILVSPVTNVSVMMMGEIHLKSFIATVVGGFGSFIGPVIGGFIIGILDNLVGMYVSLNWKTALVYGFLILILIIKPEGLFGKIRRKKV